MSVVKHDVHIFYILYIKPSNRVLFDVLTLKISSGHHVYIAFGSSHNFCNTFDIVVCFLLGNSSESEFYMQTFRNTLFHLHRHLGMKYGTSYLAAYDDGKEKVFRNVCL